MQCEFHKIEQRSAQWYILRQGKITGTSVCSILGNKTTAKGDPVKKTIEAIDNQAMLKAIEQVHGFIESDYLSFDMQRGIDSEPSARECFKQVYANENFLDVTEIGFITLNKHIGVSPDSILSNNTGLEIKCPNAKTFFKLCLTEEIDADHYKQMQHAMYVTGFQQWHYFNYLVHNNIEYYYHRIIERDQPMIDLIKSRCEEVIDIKEKYIKKLSLVKSNI